MTTSTPASVSLGPDPSSRSRPVSRAIATILWFSLWAWAAATFCRRATWLFLLVVSQSPASRRLTAVAVPRGSWR